LKVKILPKVANFHYGTVTYHPGDVVEVPDSLFSAGFMEKVEEPAPAAVTVQEEKPKPQQVQKKDAD
jgi:hypothetical protein